MKRVIFSFYIDIPKEELDIFDKELPIIKNKKALPINLITKNRLKKHYVRLLIQKQAYAKACAYSTSQDCKRLTILEKLYSMSFHQPKRD